ncbi:MAG TPA: hypothetical protein VLL73_00435, partial [Desulfurivibrionaceae bacterium]|nr:hypothetical protein [Desulfurivibrionaceae bacterium]
MWGRIAGLTPEGKVLLAIGETTVEASSSVALKVGAEFWFEVRQGGSEPWLALAEKKGAAQEVVRLLAPGSPALNRLLPALATLLEAGEGLPVELRTQLEALVQVVRGAAQGAEPAPEKLVTLLSALRGAAATAPSIPEQLAALLDVMPAEQGETSGLARSHGLLA